MDSHCIGAIKGLVAVRALPHAIGDSAVDAFVTQDMAARLENGVFDVVLTYRAHDQFLVGFCQCLSHPKGPGGKSGTYPKHVFLARRVALALCLPVVPILGDMLESLLQLLGFCLMRHGFLL